MTLVAISCMYARGIVLFPGFSHESFPGFKVSTNVSFCARSLVCLIIMMMMVILKMDDVVTP